MTSNEGSPRCLNCGAELSGPYCSQCGQEDNELRVSLKRLFRDFLAEQVGLETKVPTTLWKLVSRPGLLTKEYLAGKRVRSLLPLRLYLSASVVYFLLLSLPGLGVDLSKQVKITGVDSAAIDSASREKAANSNMTITVPGAKISGNPNGSTAERFVRKRSDRFKAMSPQESVNYFRAAFLKYMPNAVFFLLPVFAFILYLLYRTTGRFFAEHLIFALHVHAFSFVALILALILPDALDIIVPVWILVYLFIALRKVYGESRRRTAVKFAALMFTYMISLQITLLAMLGIIFAVG
ncbi:MAG TPA: DUF3667 domain-containing protein [Gemmatimonadaceae bacterium]|nr:DUF3667 domain-containing protein [Gemmatimonadaceae bacterium]